MTKLTFSAKTFTPQTGDDLPVSKEDFCRYLIQPSAYFFIPCRELWPGSSVNARLPRIPVLDANGQPEARQERQSDHYSSHQMDRR